MSRPRIEPATHRLSAYPSYRSAIGDVDDVFFALLEYLFTWCAKGYIENKNKALLTYSFVIDTI